MTAHDGEQARERAAMLQSSTNAPVFWL